MFSNKPFAAKITTVANNTILFPQSYLLLISVDGELKKTVQAQIAEMSISSATAEFIYQ